MYFCGTKPYRPQYRVLQKADTIGIFQMESRAQMRMPFSFSTSEITLSGFPLLTNSS